VEGDFRSFFDVSRFLTSSSLHEGQQRRDEANHGATEHEQSLPEVFGHEAVPFIIVPVVILATKGYPASKSPEADSLVWSIWFICLSRLFD